MNKRALLDAASGSWRGIRRTWPLLVIGFLVDAAFLFVFLIALQSYLPESLHKSDAIAGYALATFGLAKLMTQIGGGFVSDRLGPRRSMLIGTGLLIAADVSIWPFAHVAPWLILVSGAVEGLGSSITWPAIYSAGSARVPEGQKGRFTSLLTLATGGALIVGLGGGGALNAHVSFDAAMAWPVAAVIGAFVLALTLLPGMSTTVVRNALPAPGRFRAIITSRERTSFAVLVLAEAAAVGGLTAVFRAYGRDVLGVSLYRQALLLLPAAIAGGVLVVPGGAIADRIGARRVMTVGFAMAGACLIALARYSDAAQVLPIAAAAGGGFGLAMPGIAATMMRLAGPDGSRGGVIGWFMTVDGLGHAVGPAAAGVILAVFGASAVLVGAGVLFLAVAYVALVSRLSDDARAVTEAVPAGSSTLIGGQS
jgi:DHA1 family tetracycline resistance protein-like MFS transporter